MLIEPKTGQNKYSVSFVYFCWTFFNQSLDLKSNILSHDICVVLIVCLRAALPTWFGAYQSNNRSKSTHVDTNNFILLCIYNTQ